jgi:hypothetical protein
MGRSRLNNDRGAQITGAESPKTRLTLQGEIDLGVGASVGAGNFALLEEAGEVAGLAV